MSTTPWGESTELRKRRLQPGPGVPREDVETNQRERLYGATVAVIADKGYGRATVSDLIEMAGVSRTTFYRYFPDKEACFLETLGLLLEGITALIRNQLRVDGSPRERAEAGMGSFIAALVSQDDAARICAVESDAAGPRATAMVDAAATEFGKMLAAVFSDRPDHRDMPREILDAMVGGVRKLLQMHLHRRTEEQLVDLVPDIVRLGLSYEAPPKQLPDRAPRVKARPSVPRSTGIDEPAQRLELVAMEIMAREGYAATNVATVAREAHVSLATLYAIYDDKSALFDAALLRSRMRMAAAVAPAFHRAANWPEAIAALIRASLSFLEAEPHFARLMTIEVARAGTTALESRDRAFDAALHYIESGIPPDAGDQRIVAEAILSSLYAMLAARVSSRHKNLQGMAPLAIYMTLAPFLGPAEAYRHAVE